MVPLYDGATDGPVVHVALYYCGSVSAGDIDGGDVARTDVVSKSDSYYYVDSVGKYSCGTSSYLVGVWEVGPDVMVCSGDDVVASADDGCEH